MYGVAVKEMLFDGEKKRSYNGSAVVAGYIPANLRPEKSCGGFKIYRVASGDTITKTKVSESFCFHLSPPKSLKNADRFRDSLVKDGIVIFIREIPAKKSAAKPHPLNKILSCFKMSKSLCDHRWSLSGRRNSRSGLWKRIEVSEVE